MKKKFSVVKIPESPVMNHIKKLCAIRARTTLNKKLNIPFARASAKTARIKFN